MMMDGRRKVGVHAEIALSELDTPGFDVYIPFGVEGLKGFVPLASCR